MISVIIPVYNEDKIMEINVSSFDVLSRQPEIIFVDVGSADKTVEL